jgi:hypothetical protein
MLTEYVVLQICSDITTISLCRCQCKGERARNASGAAGGARIDAGRLDCQIADRES